MSIDWAPLGEIIEAHQRFVLSSHKNPDADALGSELALAQMLESRGKSARIINPSASPDTLLFLDPEKHIKKLGAEADDQEVLDTDVHMILDTSAWQQLRNVGPLFRKSKAVKVVIDHHVSSDDLQALEFRDVTSEATGTLIYQMARSLGFDITREIAVPLFCAIATDTGWFRFSSTKSSTYRIAADLIDAGVQPAALYEQLYERRSAARIRLAALALGRLTLECEGRLAYTWVQQSDFAASKAKPVDTENLVNECLTIAGTECAFIAIEQANREIKVSFRSRSEMNVEGIATQFGGGGHKQAAGATLPGPLSEAREKVLAAFRAALQPAAG